jgi:putative ABC transport system ATP-binding protein
VAIARAVVGEPAIVLADEPTGNLDSRTGSEVLTALRDLHAGGSTIVVITHDPTIAASMPRCVSIRDGRIEDDQWAAPPPPAEPEPEPVLGPVAPIVLRPRPSWSAPALTIGRRRRVRA